MKTNRALRRAISIAGSQERLAQKIGTSQRLVSYWLNQSKKGVAAEFVLLIEGATGVPRYDLRPDVYPRSRDEAA